MMNKRKEFCENDFLKLINIINLFLKKSQGKGKTKTRTNKKRLCEELKSE